jgi:hypothetical protein
MNGIEKLMQAYKMMQKGVWALEMDEYGRIVTRYYTEEEGILMEIEELMERILKKYCVTI